VVDRTQLILDIFARHCAEPEGQLQVELAQLNYMLPRLSGKGTAMSRLGGKSGGVAPAGRAAERDAIACAAPVKRNSKPTPPDTRPHPQDPTSIDEVRKQRPAA